MNPHVRIALFGESEKGDYSTAYFCNSLPQLVDNLGNPPEESRGIYCAVQALLYDHRLIYFRVEEEGFSIQDYFQGIHLLKKDNLSSEIGAICIPGVGDMEIIEAMTQPCMRQSHVLITQENDLYDYLMT